LETLSRSIIRTREVTSGKEGNKNRGYKEEEHEKLARRRIQSLASQKKVPGGVLWGPKEKKKTENKSIEKPTTDDHFSVTKKPVSELDTACGQQGGKKKEEKKRNKVGEGEEVGDLWQAPPQTTHQYARKLKRKGKRKEP